MNQERGSFGLITVQDCHDYDPAYRLAQWVITKRMLKKAGLTPTVRSLKKDNIGIERQSEDSNEIKFIKKDKLSFREITTVFTDDGKSIESVNFGIKNEITNDLDQYKILRVDIDNFGKVCLKALELTNNIKCQENIEKGNCFRMDATSFLAGHQNVFRANVI